jgi:hypothetical protein
VLPHKSQTTAVDRLSDVSASGSIQDFVAALTMQCNAASSSSCGLSVTPTGPRFPGASGRPALWAGNLERIARRKGCFKLSIQFAIEALSFRFVVS